MVNLIKEKNIKNYDFILLAFLKLIFNVKKKKENIY